MKDFWSYVAVIVLIEGYPRLARRLAALSDSFNLASLPLTDEQRNELRLALCDEKQRTRLFRAAEVVSQRSVHGLLLLHNGLIDYNRADPLGPQATHALDAASYIESLKMIAQCLSSTFLERQYSLRAPALQTSTLERR